MDKIFIQELKTEAIIGINAHERTIKQPLIFDIELFTDIKEAAVSGDIRKTINYDDVASYITNFAAESQYELLETLIEALSNALLNTFKLSRINCTVYKPLAIKNAKATGVNIVRERELPIAKHSSKNRRD